MKVPLLTLVSHILLDRLSWLAVGVRAQSAPRHGIFKRGLLGTWLVALGCLMGLVALAGCSRTTAQNPDATPTATPVRLLAQLTPTPAKPLFVILTPTVNFARQLVQALPTQPPPTATQLPSATATVTPAPTATPTATPTADPAATPGAAVIGATLVNLYTGPSETYPALAAWAPNIPLAISGQSLDGQWLEVCCIRTEDNAQARLWVRWDPNFIQVVNAHNLNTLARPVLPAPPVATAVPFARARGPELFGTGNTFLNILAKIYVGDESSPTALPGYYLAVEFQAEGEATVQKRLNQSSQGESVNQFTLAIDTQVANYKFEYSGALGKGNWTFWLTDAAGYTYWQQGNANYLNYRLSDPVTVAIDGNSPQRLIFVAWQRVR